MSNSVSDSESLAHNPSRFRLKRKLRIITRTGAGFTFVVELAERLVAGMIGKPVPSDLQWILQLPTAPSPSTIAKGMFIYTTHAIPSNFFFFPQCVNVEGKGLR